MATHRTDVSVGSGVPGLLETTVRTIELPLLRVPDVRLRSEAAAIATIAEAGLVPGQRSPRPRPASGRSEVVIRTSPRAGTLVRRGTRIDYELLPGEPRMPGSSAAHRDHDAAVSLEDEVEPCTPTAVGRERLPDIDDDVIDTRHRSASRPEERQA